MKLIKQSVVNNKSLGTRSVLLKFLTSIFICFAGSTMAADLRVMKTGLGKGWIEGTGISCGVVGINAFTNEDVTDDECDETSNNNIILTARSLAGSTFAEWGGDCARVPGSTLTCEVSMDQMRSVRAHFTLDNAIPQLSNFTPLGINAYLSGDGRNVNTQAEFVAALPDEFKQNWILMTRSESLQTGTSEFPRIMLINEAGTQAFTLGLVEHSSYPGSHPNAIEYMQWDDRVGQKNFRFHEIILDRVPNMDETTAGSGVFRFPERNVRGLHADDPKCFACHSTGNVINRGTTPGTTGISIGSVKFKSKPNWDTYDSWGGMLGFNRDRIYKGSIEAAAFRKTMNLWTWQKNEAIRSVIEQLDLQPPGVRAQDAITRWDQGAPGDSGSTSGGENDGHIHFFFDPPYPTVVKEPIPTSPPGTSINVAYTFDRATPTGTASAIVRNTDFVVLQHTDNGTGVARFGFDEGRGTNFFNNLYLGLNPQRIVDEISPKAPATSIFATGNVPIDVRPIALAIADSCISVTGGTDTALEQGITGIAIPSFFQARNGMDFDDVYDDTRRRAQSTTRRKADIQKLNLDRSGDVYADSSLGSDANQGLIDLFEAETDGLVPNSPGNPVSKRLRQLRQEVFRRPIDFGHPDETAMGRIYVDREDDSTDPIPNDTPPPFLLPRFDNTAPISLYRYLLEPLGVSVDKWSMGVRGRSRTYSFADNFSAVNSYTDTFSRELRTSLGVSDCGDTLRLVAAEFSRLPSAADTPTYTDVQRIYNKSCIECHGGLYYPPVRQDRITLDFSEDEKPIAGQRRLWKSLSETRTLIGGPVCSVNTPTCTSAAALDVSNSYLYDRITDYGALVHPYNPASASGADERCPNGVMPCGGPPLSKTDIETVKRWIIGGSPSTEGDPHIRTVDGVDYDFQSAGEFVLLRDPGMELQARQSAVTTAGPLRADSHTGLSSCVSVNTAVAMRVGEHKISYQPDLTEGNDDENPDKDRESLAQRLQLIIDDKPALLGEDTINLQKGGRIVPTNDQGGMEVHFPGGTRVAVTPSYWERHQMHFMHINVYHSRASDGVMGAVAPNNWLPRLSNGDFLGPRPVSLAQRHTDLYTTFADSWRVKANNSLFHYERGLGPDSFVVQGWPVSAAQNCSAPPQPGVPIPSAAPAPEIEKAQAEQFCAAIDDLERRENCVQDVMATGDTIFVEAYLQSQELDQRILIAPATPVKPARNAILPGSKVDFKWTPTTGTEEVDVTHYHCIWKSSERYDFNNCIVLSVDGGPLDEILPAVLVKYLSPVVCIILILILVALALTLFIRRKRKASMLLLLLALIVTVICWLEHQAKSNEPTSVSKENLDAGETYRWKVVNETKDGLLTESETFRFEVQD